VRGHSGTKAKIFPQKEDDESKKEYTNVVSWQDGPHIISPERSSVRQNTFERDAYSSMGLGSANSRDQHLTIETDLETVLMMQTMRMSLTFNRPRYLVYLC